MCSGRGILIADNVLRLPDNSPFWQHFTRGSYSVRPYHTPCAGKSKQKILRILENLFEATGDSPQCAAVPAVSMRAQRLTYRYFPDPLGIVPASKYHISIPGKNYRVTISTGLALEMTPAARRREPSFLVSARK